jgi:hypothetical protein
LIKVMPKLDPTVGEDENGEAYYVDAPYEFSGNDFEACKAAEDEAKMRRTPAGLYRNMEETMRWPLSFQKRPKQKRKCYFG